MLCGKVANRGVNVLRGTAHADDHATKRQILDLVECTKEHGNLDLWEAANHIREHGIIRRLAEEGQAQQHVTPRACRLLDGVAAKGGWQLV